MKQKKIRTDILCMIIFVIWTIVAAFLFFGVAQNEDADTEKIIKILKILFGALYMPVVFFPFIFVYLHSRSKATVDGKPLSLEATKENVSIKYLYNLNWMETKARQLLAG